ncbi:MAG: 5'/3'-nucleotidase SurE [Bacilli bacterium]|nr:5'/3'-nucleotidase SurE [Bacilli bacterium]
MKILLVNDDGYNREGIRLLYKKLQKYGEVTLLAPLNHYSGASASFTLDKGFTLKKYEENIYSLDGSPVDCVLFGLTSNLFDFDIIISGCNNGLNLSYDVIYSGTLGACSEALVHNIPAIAFSTDFDHFTIVDQYFDEVFSYILDNNLIKNNRIINVNFPRKQFNKVKGIKLTKLYNKPDKFYYEVIDNKYYAKRIEIFDDAPINTDVYCANHGYVSITPLNRNAFSLKLYNDIKKEMKKGK